MDTLTHALSGMLLARATVAVNQHGATSQDVPSVRARMTAGLLAAAFPDLDIISHLFGPISYLNFHRGLTHSVLILPLWAWLLALLFAALWRGRYRWQLFYGVSAMGIGVHIIGDVITAYGTMVFAPLSDYRLAWPATFIIDLYFTGIIAAALLLAWAWKKHAILISRAGMVLLISYVGLQGYLHQQALIIAKDYSQRHELAVARLEALPQPLSPLNWKLIVSTADEYHIAYINLLRQQPLRAGRDESLFHRIAALYQPVLQARWLIRDRFGRDEKQRRFVRAVWSQEILKDIRHFMLYPMLADLEQRDAGLCAWFMDQRFSLEGIRAPFQFGVCRKNGSAAWRLYRRQGKQAIPLFH